MRLRESASGHSRVALSILVGVVLVMAAVLSGVVGTVLGGHEGAQRGGVHPSNAASVAPPEDGGIYTDAAVLQTTLINSGLPCQTEAASDTPDMAACVDAGGVKWIVKTYTTTDAQVAAIAKIGRSSPGVLSALVYGRNWVVMFRDAADAQSAVKAIGGHYVLLETS